MKTHNLIALLISALAMSLTGCSRQESKNPATPPEKGTMQTAVDGFTGKTAVDVGLKAKDQILKANEKEMQDRNEAMQ